MKTCADRFPLASADSYTPPMPAESPLQDTLARLYTASRHRDDGEVASYIPELSRADPAHFAVCLTTVAGNSYCEGDHDVPFTMQSISKPFVYGLALDDQGLEAVMHRAGVEPSGEAFNAISLEPGTGRPRNPMINAGAIATASLILGDSPAHRLERTIAMFSAYAGRPLQVDAAVYESERETGHRNRAIGHLLRNARILDGDVDEVVNRYFQQCSVLVNARDLALMAATLANGGRNPITGEQAVAPANVERVLSVMSTCGMYDAAGAWVYGVGMPAKSGVAGGIIAVLPGQFGIGVYSPRLDASGNSVRGVAFCEAISREFGLHLFRPPLNTGAVVRTASRLTEIRSRRHRRPAELAELARSGHAAVAYALQGPLVFATVEIVLRRAHEEYEAGQVALFDCARVSNFELPAARLLGMFAASIAASGGSVAFAGVDPESPGAVAIAAGAGDARFEVFPDIDLALEWAEDTLLARSGLGGLSAEESLRSHPFFEGLGGDEFDAVERICERCVFSAGEHIVSLGAPSDRIYLVVSGKVAVSLPANGGGRRHRLASLGPGTTFGEISLIAEGPRSADVHAEESTVCYAIRLDDLAEATARAPGLRLRLVEGVARDLAGRLFRANAEILALAR